MSWYPARKVFDGLNNIFRNIPIAALSATGTPSSTTFLRGDGTWNTPAGGSAQLSAVAVKTANYTASSNQIIPCDVSGGGFTVTLPTSPSDGDGMVIKVIKQAATPNTLTFNCAGSAVFNVASGPTSGTLTLLNQAVRLQYYATAAIWYVISTDEPLSQMDTRYGGTVVEYTSTQTAVSVPAGVTGVWIESLIAPGGGGGSGRRGASGTVCCGGGGGATGGIVEDRFYRAALLGSTFTVTLPAGGAGGAAVTTDNTNGNNGVGVGVASFASGSLLVTTFPGVAAVGGTALLGTGGTAGTTMWPGVPGGSASTTGGVGVAGLGTTSGAASGGGSGGGIAATPAAVNGGAGGQQILNYFNVSAAAGVAGGASPGTGGAALAGVGGQGAGGGASSITGAAQAGADAAGYGAGGGGGGGALNGNLSGKGGNGGGSYCRLRWVYA